MSGKTPVGMKVTGTSAGPHSNPTGACYSSCLEEEAQREKFPRLEPHGSAETELGFELRSGWLQAGSVLCVSQPPAVFWVEPYGQHQGEEVPAGTPSPTAAPLSLCGLLVCSVTFEQRFWLKAV